MFSGLVSNKVNIVKYNTYKQKLLGVLSNCTGVRQPEPSTSENCYDKEESSLGCAAEMMFQGDTARPWERHFALFPLEFTFLQYFLEPLWFGGRKFYEDSGHWGHPLRSCLLQHMLSFSRPHFPPLGNGYKRLLCLPTGLLEDYIRSLKWNVF